MNAAELLAFLSARGGQEYRVTTLLHIGRGKKASVRELGDYCLTVRGEAVQATGPSGQTRLLNRHEFMTVFSSYAFGAATATGELTDLGPLFG